MNPTRNHDRKRLGQYYTPKKVADVLARWAIRSGQDTVLEPSFGRCSFLKSVVDALKAREASNPLNHIFGCDLDESAFKGAYEQLFGERSQNSRFKHTNFLATDSRTFSQETFDVVIGNPPYVSHHNMSAAQRETVEAVMNKSDLSLDRKASLWAYFVVHGLRFLAEGGRIAWILPGSFLYADYSTAIRDIIGAKFARSLALEVDEKIFHAEGSSEISVILLAEGWQRADADSGLRLGFVSDVPELTSRIERWQAGDWEGALYNDKVTYIKARPEVRQAIDTVRDCFNVVRIGDIADVKIGIVTGDNRLFLVDREVVRAHDLEHSDWKYIYSRPEISRGLSVTRSDFEKARQSDIRCMLVDAEQDTSSALDEYLSQRSDEEIESNVTFGKRDNWKIPDDGRYPDAFFTYMSDYGARLVINSAEVNSTNNIHRVWFKDRVSAEHRCLVALSLQSTFSQLSAELEGRIYGSGLLKHEISDTEEIELILPSIDSPGEISSLYNRVDEMMKSGARKEAELAVDEYLFAKSFKVTGTRLLEVLGNGLGQIRGRRQGKYSKVR